MIKYFKTFFYPPILTYSYNYPKDLVIAKIREVLKNQVTLFSSNDTTGSFLNTDTFVIVAVSAINTRGIKYRSILIGKIIESQTEITKIETKAKPSFVLYLLFFATIIFGLIYFYKFIQTGWAGFLFWSLAMLIFGPVLSINFSMVAISSIRERYKMYIDKELNTELS